MAIRLQLKPVDKMMHRFASEQAGTVIMAQKSIAVGANAAGRGDRANRARQLEHLHGPGWNQPIGFRVGSHLPDNLRVADRGIAAQVFIRQGQVPGQYRIVAPKPVPLRVTDAPLLGAAGGRFNGAGVWLDAEIPVAQLQNFAGFMAFYFPAEQPATAMEPAIQSGSE